MAQIIVIFILNHSHIFSIDSSFNLYHKSRDHRALNFKELFIDGVQVPFLVNISIVVVSDKFLIDFAAFAWNVDVFLGVCRRLQSKIIANVNNDEVLFWCSCVGLHEKLTGPRLFLALGDCDHLAVHSAHNFYGVVHYILLL